VKDTRADYLQVQQVYLPIALAVFAIVVGLTLFAVVRYRRRSDGRRASQKSESKAEYVYAAFLALTAAFLVGWTFHVEDREDRVAGAAPLDVHVTASQWTWRFDYVGRRVSVVGSSAHAPTLVVPTGVPVRFQMTSPDVIHSFWIPARRFKRDAFPGTTTRFSLMWDNPGLDRGARCAEFCGLDHDAMLFSVRALAPAAFRAWMASR
jgi:cytochrome c oxidase subunit 2